jgi:hypothetical protein
MINNLTDNINIIVIYEIKQGTNLGSSKGSLIIYTNQEEMKKFTETHLKRKIYENESLIFTGLTFKDIVIKYQSTISDELSDYIEILRNNSRVIFNISHGKYIVCLVIFLIILIICK